MKKQRKILMFLMFIFIILINVNSYAMGPHFFDGKINGSGTDKIFATGSGILNLIQLIGVGMAVIASLVLGIRYLYSTSTEKAEIKNKLIPWIIGGVLIFGAVQIVKFIEDVASV